MKNQPTWFMLAVFAVFGKQLLQWKTISLTRTIVILVSLAALLTKDLPSFSFATAICAQRCEKTTAPATEIHFNLQV